MRDNVIRVRKWNCLVELGKKLRAGEVDLDQLHRFLQNKKSSKNHDHGINLQNKKSWADEKNHDHLHHGNNLENNKSSVDDGKEVMGAGAETSDHKNSNPRPKIRLVWKGMEDDKRKRAKVVKPKSNDPVVMSEETRRRIVDFGGDVEKAVLVIKKKLFKCDVADGHDRLSLPRKQADLSLMERAELDATEEDEGLSLWVIEPKVENGECGMRVRYWSTNSQYALIGNWKGFCKRNHLEEDTHIQVWSFKKNHKFCLAIVPFNAS